MIKSITEKKQGKIEIDLTGPDGNAFYLIGVARKLGSQIGMSPKEIGIMTTEMMSGDYENVITTFDEKFGDLVIMYRSM